MANVEKRFYYSEHHCLLCIGKQILNRHYADIKEAIASGTVDDTKAVGLLDQWLIEGKYTEEEALILCCDMLAAGMDTVSCRYAMYKCFKRC